MCFTGSKKILTAVTLAALTATSSVALAAPPNVKISPSVESSYKSILSQSSITKTLADIKADDANALTEVFAINKIPSPPFGEEKRATYLLERFKKLGLKDAYIDKEGNVIGLRKGSTGKGPLLVISAHIDTVFPAGTDLTVKERDGKYYAPGLIDNTRGVVTMLAVIKAVNENQIKTVGDVIFIANVGEEGEGDLRGVKAFFRDHKNVSGFISIDSNSPLSNVTNKATGSHRYEVIFKGPGGHSFSAFGKFPSATHAMGRAIAKVGDLQVPADPKTTFTVGTVTGGSSVNAIAAEARMKLDLRSNSTDALLELEKRAVAAIHAGVAEENKRWNSEQNITVELKPIGVRPAGTTADDSLIVQATEASLNALGSKIEVFTTASTDSNLPMSLGIPSVTIAKGGIGGGAHSLNEWYEHKDAYKAAQNALLLMIGLVGLEGVSQPILQPIK